MSSSLATQSVDELILHGMRQLGVSIPTDMVTITNENFSKELFYLATVICLRAIYEKIGKTPEEFPETFPESTGDAFRLCTSLARIVEEIGYRKKLGFETFLYPNAESVRSLLSFLNEKAAPEEEEATEEEHADVTLEAKLQSRLAQIVGKLNLVELFPEEKKFYPLRTTRLHCPSVDHAKIQALHFDSLSLSVAQNVSSNVEMDEAFEIEWREKGVDSGLSEDQYYAEKAKNMKLSMSTILRHEKNESTLSDDFFLLNKERKEEFFSCFANRLLFESEDYTAPQEILHKETEEEILERRTTEIETLEGNLKKVDDYVLKLTEQLEMLEDRIRQTEEVLEEEKAQKEKLQEKYKITLKTFNLVSDKKGNLIKMQKESSASAAKLLKLANEWEKTRVPLIEKFRQTESGILNSKDELKNLMTEYQQTQKDILSTIQDIKQKENTITLKQKEYDALPKDKHRDDYVNKILKVVEAVRRQREEISKVLSETRELQNNISNIKEKLGRSFQQTEELIFESAQTKSSKDQYAKSVYKNVLDLRKKFESIGNLVQATGKSSKSIRDLENQIDQIQKRNDTLNMERVTNDLEMIQKENEDLIKNVKIGQQKLVKLQQLLKS